MRYLGNIVSAEDTRSKGHGVSSKCFYCNGVLYGPHDEDCVCLDRPVKVRLTIDLVVTVPRHQSQEDMEWRWNEGSYCMDNILDEIERHKADGNCLCNLAEIRYTGEATIAEAVAVGLNPDTDRD